MKFIIAYIVGMFAVYEQVIITAFSEEKLRTETLIIMH